METTGSLKFNGKSRREEGKGRKDKEGGGEGREGLGRVKLMTGRCGGYWNAAEMVTGFYVSVNRNPTQDRANQCFKFKDHSMHFLQS